MKDRIVKGRQTTITSLALLGFFAFAIYRHPALLDKPETLIALAGGLIPLFLKDPK